MSFEKLQTIVNKKLDDAILINIALTAKTQCDVLSLAATYDFNNKAKIVRVPTLFLWFAIFCICVYGYVIRNEKYYIFSYLLMCVWVFVSLIYYFVHFKWFLNTRSYINDLNKLSKKFQSIVDRFDYLKTTLNTNDILSIIRELLLVKNKYEGMLYCPSYHFLQKAAKEISNG